jgi:hypothetical protein
MNQYRFIIIDEYLSSCDKLQAMSNVVYLIFCKVGSLKRMILTMVADRA